MKNQTLRIAIACSTGALIGTLISLQIYPSLWFFGIFAGGLIGYLGYDWKEAGQACATAARSISKLRLNKALWFARFRTVKYICCTIMKYAVVYFIHVIPVASFGRFTLMIFLFVIVPIVFFVGIAAQVFNEMSGRSLRGELKAAKIYRQEMMSTDSVIEILCVEMRYISRLLLELLMVGRRFFILVHSEMRLLCGIDSAIGTAVGYYFDNALIGAVAGAIFGVVNYWVVSVGLLGLRRPSV